LTVSTAYKRDWSRDEPVIKMFNQNTVNSGLTEEFFPNDFSLTESFLAE